MGGVIQDGIGVVVVGMHVDCNCDD
jgi:hypothetical protein